MLDNAKQLFSHMSDDGVKANPQTFAAMFECVERSEEQDKVELLQDYKQQMQQMVIFYNFICSVV